MLVCRRLRSRPLFRVFGRVFVEFGVGADRFLVSQSRSYRGLYVYVSK